VLEISLQRLLPRKAKKISNFSSSIKFANGFTRGLELATVYRTISSVSFSLLLTYSSTYTIKSNM